MMTQNLTDDAGTELARRVIQAKGLAGAAPCRITIYDRRGARIGEMEAFSPSLVTSLPIAAAISAWRNAHRSSFLTQFDATTERTLTWLRDTILPNHGRVLFLVRESEGTPVGICGLTDIREGVAELDGALRGERAGHPGLFYFAESHLMNWARQELGIHTFEARILTSNRASLSLFTSLGLRPTEKLPLLREGGDGNGDNVSYSVTDQESANCSEMLWSLELVTGPDSFSQMGRESKHTPIPAA